MVIQLQVRLSSLENNTRDLQERAQLASASAPNALIDYEKEEAEITPLCSPSFGLDGWKDRGTKCCSSTEHWRHTFTNQQLRQYLQKYVKSLEPEWRDDECWLAVHAISRPRYQFYKRTELSCLRSGQKVSENMSAFRIIARMKVGVSSVDSELKVMC